MSSAELTYWRAYNKIEPFGSERDELHTALLAQMQANSNRGKGQKAHKLEDFMIIQKRNEEARKGIVNPDRELEIFRMLGGKKL